MDDFISREAALKIPCKHCDYPDDKNLCPYKFTGCTMYYDLFELPAADVRPVVHGKWEPIYFSEDGGRSTYFLHRQCGCEVEEESNYCPRCGAQMDGR